MDSSWTMRAWSPRPPNYSSSSTFITPGARNDRGDYIGLHFPIDSVDVKAPSWPPGYAKPCAQ